MATTPNRDYPIPNPSTAIHPGVRDLAMAIDADVGNLVAGILIDPITMTPIVDPITMDILTE